MLAYNKFSNQEKAFLGLVNEDYVALGEVAGFFSITNYPRPTEKEYLEALEFIKYLMDKYKDKLKCLEGPEPHQIHMTAEEFTNWLKEMWYTGKYQEIYYGIWFDLEPEEDKVAK